jgi:hypothetical protein
MSEFPWRLTAQDVVDIDIWVGHLEHGPGALDACCGIDESAIHVEQTLFWRALSTLIGLHPCWILTWRQHEKWSRALPNTSSTYKDKKESTQSDEKAESPYFDDGKQFRMIRSGCRSLDTVCLLLPSDARGPVSSEQQEATAFK